MKTRPDRAMALLATACLVLSACGRPEPEPGSTSGSNGNDWTRAIATPTSATPAEDAAAMERRAEAEAAERAEMERLFRIEETRRADPALNWVNVGISTGKFSESIDTSIHRTHDECMAVLREEDSSCFPIARLPDSYWEAEVVPPPG